MNYIVYFTLLALDLFLFTIFLFYFKVRKKPSYICSSTAEIRLCLQLCAYMHKYMFIKQTKNTLSRWRKLTSAQCVVISGPSGLWSSRSLSSSPVKFVIVCLLPLAETTLKVAVIHSGGCKWTQTNVCSVLCVHKLIMQWNLLRSIMSSVHFSLLHSPASSAVPQI